MENTSTNTLFVRSVQLGIATRKALSSSAPVGIVQAAKEFSHDGSRKRGEAFAAGLLSAGFFLGAASNYASCEQGKKRSVADPDLYPSESSAELHSIVGTGPQDPMTVYAKMAIKRVSEGAKGPTAQATSPSSNATVEKISSKYMNEMTADELRIEEATRKAKQHSGG